MVTFVGEEGQQKYHGAGRRSDTAAVSTDLEENAPVGDDRQCAQT